MVESVNPYAAPRSDAGSTAACESIDFDGEVRMTDVAALLPNMLLGRLLLVLYGLVVLPLAAVVVGSIALGTTSPGESVGVVFFLVSLIAVSTYALSLSRRGRRAAVLVAKDPHMLGTVRGSLSPQGYERIRAGRSETIPWSAFHAVDVLRAGVRLQRHPGDQPFIALPAHCFAGYDRQQMRWAVSVFRSSASAETYPPAVTTFIPVGWNPPPADAIRFDGVVDDGPRRRDSVKQHGWISCDRIFSVVQGTSYYDNWQVVEQISHDAEQLTILWLDKTRLQISRQHLIDPTEWDALLQLAAAGIKDHRCRDAS